MTVPPLPTRRLSFSSADQRPSGHLEWLVTNGLGGYACGTVAGGLTRRYHGLLIAALPAPLGRMLYVSQVRATIVVDGDERIVDHEDLTRLEQPDVLPLVEFRLDGGLPVWRYRVGPAVLEKRIVMVYGTNTTIVRYQVVGPAPTCTLRLTPLIQVRPHDSQTPVVRPDTMHLEHIGHCWHLHVGEAPLLTWAVHGDLSRADFSTPLDAALEYSVERERGYAHAGRLWYPGVVEMWCEAGHGADFILSTEPADNVAALDPETEFLRERERREQLLVRAGSHAHDPLAAELVVAADQFLIQPATRRQEVIREDNRGEPTCTVIAGYHWFTDWGRDTMISLEGLTMCTGRTDEAAAILRTFARYVRDGLIPNMFPEGEQQGLYHTADATLWFLHAMDRYLTLTGDRTLVADLLPVVEDVIEHHLAGTRFGIGVDPADGLLTQGAPHYQLTWMDAKVGDWVVTPRRGKAVEINALWYNALRLAADWMAAAGRTVDADKYRTAAERAFESFNRRFWNPHTGHLFDVVDGEQGDDPACRPNQVLAISLRHPVLAREHWQPVIDTVERVLVTPVGLRSLAPGHPDYQRRYFGDLRTRDAAYHQGTVWAWLIGPFLDAWLRLHPDDGIGMDRFLSGFSSHLSEACVGSISEIFDAEDPFTPRGCVAQTWSVAEVLRCLVRGHVARAETPPVVEVSRNEV